MNEQRNGRPSGGRLSAVQVPRPTLSLSGSPMAGVRPKSANSWTGMASPGAGTGKGAAEEPEPEPGESSDAGALDTATTTAAASYDPREYQVHPDDRGGGGGGGGKLPKKKGGGGKKGATGKAKGEGAEKEKSKGEDEEAEDGTHRCGNCDAPDAKSKCKGCGVVYYCNRECQTVRARVAAE